MPFLKAGLNESAAKAALKVKLSPKSNPGFICECIGVKPSCKSIITMKEALYQSFVFGLANFQVFECRGTLMLASKSLFLKH